MPVTKGRKFAEHDVYIDFPFEEVMYRWDHLTRKAYVKFYGSSESPDPVPHDNQLFNEALRSGTEISRDEYLAASRPVEPN